MLSESLFVGNKMGRGQQERVGGVVSSDSLTRASITSSPCLTLSLSLSFCGVNVMLYYLGFVEFSSVDDCVKALSKNREPIGDRYIEVRLLV